MPAWHTYTLVRSNGSNALHFGKLIAKAIAVVLAMPIMRITNSGLRTIAVMVAVLWLTIVMEKVTIHRAQADVVRALDQLRLLRQRREARPVQVPLPVDRQAPGRAFNS